MDFKNPDGLKKRRLNWWAIIVPSVVSLIAGALAEYYQNTVPPPWLTWGFPVFVLTSMLAVMGVMFEWTKSDRKRVQQEFAEAREKFLTEVRSRQREFMDQMLDDRALGIQLPNNLRKLEEHLKDLLKSRDSQLFRMVATKALDALRDDFRSMAVRKRYTLRLITPTDEYMKNWVDLMSRLMKPGGEVVFVANTVIWSGKYLLAQSSAYSYAHKKGLNVKRVLVVPSDDMLTADPKLQAEVLANLELYQYHLGEVQTVETRVHKAANATAYRAHFLSDGGDESDNFGIWKSEDFEVCCLVSYREEPQARYEIKSITFTLDARLIETKRYTFDRLSGKGMGLADYIAWLKGGGGGRNAEVVKLVPKPSFADLEGV